ncbi:hypothetical protein F4802DRAFT_149050 [Xylaria palmicola]|nr:hypothetical protein F4802DRAFT_149050 [Xylaria palmicola]
MFFFNPLKFFALPFVFLAALPLALCAGFTTILAFLVLFLRLFLVYFDVGLETLQYVLVGHATQTGYLASRRTAGIAPDSSVDPTPISSPAVTSFRHQRRSKRHGSGGSGSITPVSGADRLSVVTPSIGLERDFEGIGGWRLGDADEQQWYNLNSRLENPYRRHSFRSQSGGPVMSVPIGSRTIAKLDTAAGSHSPERPKLTPPPTRSSSRTPKPHGFTKMDQESYFAG